MLVELRPFVRLEFGGRGDKWRHDKSARDVENIPRDGRSRWFRSGSRTDEQDASGKVAVDRNRVGDAGHFSEGGILEHQRGRHARFDTGLRLTRDTKQLDAIAEAVSSFDVRLRDRLNAFDVNLIESNLRPKSEAREQSELMRSIESADVERR